ncbi:hypothetical protein [Acidomonas methanolica]|uniref:hypothetical protein n=1 Tax=Acidomonas methanolica TaxID=437 RepID=UPI0005AABF30|nr:hypothetical protein [Acidomonas methanolica]
MKQFSRLPALNDATIGRAVLDLVPIRHSAAAILSIFTVDVAVFVLSPGRSSSERSPSHVRPDGALHQYRNDPNSVQ